MPATFPPGALVKARGREWVVLPDSTDDVLLVRPIGGLDDEVVGICKTIEPVTTASFSLPNWENPGDFNSCRLLRDAARLSTRSAAGPFRSFGKIAVDPRPYQLVPLLMAMRLDPVRLLIADDVGIGKTVEACLIAKELLERGEVTRLAVLCPPHLAEQWQREIAEKFHIDAELVLSSTVQRLERGLQPGESIYKRYRYIIVSTDFIKSHRRRDDFIRECPELVIVDDAHNCTLSGKVGQARQARFELIKAISDATDRNLILVTATPHSGNEDAFRSLLSLIDPKFRDLPRDLESDSRSSVRAELADARSVAFAVIPRVGVGNSMPLLFLDEEVFDCLFACGCFNSFALDYVARQKASGGNLNFYVMKQLPILPPAFFETEGCQVTRQWVALRVLELTYTAWDLEAFALDCGYAGPPFRWDEERRFLLRCELDAAYFHLYLESPSEPIASSQVGSRDTESGLSPTPYLATPLLEMFPTPREAVDYIMETFPIVKRKDIKRTAIKNECGDVTQEGRYITKDTILEIYDEMQQAIDTGHPYQTRLDPPPGPPSDRDGNFIPMAEWDQTNWPPHIHQPRESVVSD